MADGIYTFDERGMQAIVAMVREWQRRVTSLERQLMTRHEANYKPAQVFIAKTGGSGIPAASGDVPGSATVTLYRMPSSTLEAAVYTETVYNKNTTAIAANTYIEVMEEALTNKFFAVPEGGSGGDFILGTVFGGEIDGSNASAAALSSGGVNLQTLASGVPTSSATTITAYNLTSFPIAEFTEVKVYKSAFASDVYFCEPTFRAKHSGTYPAKPYARWEYQSVNITGTGQIFYVANITTNDIVEMATDDEGVSLLIGGKYILELHINIEAGDIMSDTSNLSKQVVRANVPTGFYGESYSITAGTHVLRWVTDSSLAAGADIIIELDKIAGSEYWVPSGFGYLWPMFN